MAKVLELPKQQARGQMPRGQMNGTELAYFKVLEQRMQFGAILWFFFEGLTLKLAADCRYTPDFVVMNSEGLIECHEVKGFWRDDAKVKIRVAASLFPFRFVAVKKMTKRDGGGFAEQEF